MINIQHFTVAVMEVVTNNIGKNTYKGGIEFAKRITNK
jgi:hypothetical protein